MVNFTRWKCKSYDSYWMTYTDSKERWWLFRLQCNFKCFESTKASTGSSLKGPSRQGSADRPVRVSPRLSYFFFALVRPEVSKSALVLVRNGPRFPIFGCWSGPGPIGTGPWIPGRWWTWSWLYLKSNLLPLYSRLIYILDRRSTNMVEYAKNDVDGSESCSVSNQGSTHQNLSVQDYRKKKSRTISDQLQKNKNISVRIRKIRINGPRIPASIVLLETVLWRLWLIQNIWSCTELWRAVNGPSSFFRVSMSHPVWVIRFAFSPSMIIRTLEKYS